MKPLSLFAFCFLSYLLISFVLLNGTYQDTLHGRHVDLFSIFVPLSIATLAQIVINLDKHSRGIIQKRLSLLSLRSLQRTIIIILIIFTYISVEVISQFNEVEMASEEKTMQMFQNILFGAFILLPIFTELFFSKYFSEKE